MASFQKIVRSILQQLSSTNYPVHNSQLFLKIWLTHLLDQDLTNMRALFCRLNQSGIKIDISTFPKANKTRDDVLFPRVYAQLMRHVKRKNLDSQLMLFPIDSTVALSRVNSFGHKAIIR